MDTKQIKDRIVNGINYTTGKLGFKLVKEDWGSKQQKCTCAMGCVLLHNDHGIASDDCDQNEVEAAHVLGVQTDWINSFIAGYDGCEKEDSTRSYILDEGAFEIGKEIAAQYNPPTLSDAVEGDQD